MRGLRRVPGFALAAVLTLALGIGACTAMFSALDAVLLRSFLPNVSAGRLAYIWTPNHKVSEEPVEEWTPANGDFFDLQRQLHSFSALTLFEQEGVTLAAGGGARRVGGAEVLSNFFPMLRAAPIRGRIFSAADARPGAAPVVVISHALAQAEFGGDAAALDKSLTLDAHPFRVVGVMPAAFDFPTSDEAPYGAVGFDHNDIWRPLVLTPQQAADRDNSGGYTLGLLRPGVTAEAAQAEVNALMPQLGSRHTLAMLRGGWYGVVQPFDEAVVGSSARLMWLLFGAVGLVLLIACANVANLFLVRAADRGHELGVRAALGAGRGRLLRQMLGEALLLASLGGALGLAVAEGLLRLLLRFNPGGIARLGQAALDGRAVLFTLAAVLLTGIVFGLLPALTASRVNLAQLLRSEGWGIAGAPRRWRHALIVAEVGLAMLLLASSGLLARSYFNLEGVPTGFSDSTLTFGVALDARYQQPKPIGNLYRQILQRVRALPGVTAAGAASDVPLNHATTVSSLYVEGNSGGIQMVESHMVSEGYFHAMGVALLSGRTFEADDAGAKPAGVVVDAAFAQTYWPGQSPLGKRVCWCMNPGPKANWLPILGVVADVRHHSLADAAPPQVYTLLWQNWESGMGQANFVLRSALPAARLLPEIRGVVRAVDPTLPVTSLETMGQLVAAAGTQRRFQAALFAGFALAALLLAAIGLYGVMAYSVRQRTAEIGIRMALGAGRRQVLQLVVGQGMALAAAGIVLGLAGALAFTRLLAAMLYGVAPTDPVTLAEVALVLAAVALAACWFPARRAARVDPLLALRHE